MILYGASLLYGLHNAIFGYFQIFCQNMVSWRFHGPFVTSLALFHCLGTFWHHFPLYCHSYNLILQCNGCWSDQVPENANYYTRKLILVNFRRFSLFICNIFHVLINIHWDIKAKCPVIKVSDNMARSL